MITFPDGFVATRFPGYFWNTTDEKLYTMKVTGILRPMQRCNPAPNDEHTQASYRVSVNGVRQRLTIGQIKRVLVRDGTVQVANQ
jgi:hypothetical protein